MGVQLQGRYRGRVIKYNVEKGFGFVRVMHKLIQEDAFIHFSEIDKEIDAFKKLLPDQEVEFELERSHRGLVCCNLKRCDND